MTLWGDIALFTHPAAITTLRILFCWLFNYRFPTTDSQCRHGWQAGNRSVYPPEAKGAFTSWQGHQLLPDRPTERGTERPPAQPAGISRYTQQSFNLLIYTAELFKVSHMHHRSIFGHYKVRFEQWWICTSFAWSFIHHAVCNVSDCVGAGLWCGEVLWRLGRRREAAACWEKTWSFTTQSSAE